MLSLLIPGPTSLRNDIDVSSKKSFQKLATLLWTINNFPAYGDISGWNTKCSLACPSCNYDKQSHWLIYGRKFSYIGHKQFLDSNHRFRKQKKSFDGNVDMRSTPIIVSRGEIMLQTDVVANHVFGKKQINLGNKRKTREEFLIVWKKRNIFFTLPY